LHELGLNNQRLAVNGVFHASDRSDAVACAIEDLGQQALDALPASLRALPQDRVPLRAFDTVGLPALRALLTTGAGPVAATTTSMAAALALGLVQRGQAVHLSTTDPAAHLAGTLNGDVPGLTVSRIDPKVETQHYIDKIMAAKSPKLDLAEQALLLEDLQSPCSPTSTPRCATASWAPATHRWPIRLCRPCRRCPTSACCCPATSSFARRPRIVSWSASSTRRSR
jgi:arsenite-transporting ATPase